MLSWEIQQHEMWLVIALLISTAAARTDVAPSRQSPSSMPVAVARLRGGKSVEHTFAMLKPDVASDDAKVSAIKSMIREEGLEIEREERCRLSRAECETFYAEHSERAFFPNLVAFMSSGHVLKLELSGSNAIKRWRALLGPTNSATAREQAPHSVRAKFGLDGQKNAGHGSDSPESAKRELELMFAN
jgi:nucleoside diphosphate kinase